MYPKYKILEAPEYAQYRDVLNVILEDGLLYTPEQIEQALEQFKTQEVD